MSKLRIATNRIKVSLFNYLTEQLKNCLSSYDESFFSRFKKFFKIAKQEISNPGIRYLDPVFDFLDEVIDKPQQYFNLSEKEHQIEKIAFSEYLFKLIRPYLNEVNKEHTEGKYRELKIVQKPAQEKELSLIYYREQEKQNLTWLSQILTRLTKLQVTEEQVPSFRSAIKTFVNWDELTTRPPQPTKIDISHNSIVIFWHNKKGDVFRLSFSAKNTLTLTYYNKDIQKALPKLYCLNAIKFEVDLALWILKDLKPNWA